MRAGAAQAVPNTALEFLSGALLGSVPETTRPYAMPFIIVREAIS
jgi:hypothetical protein